MKNKFIKTIALVSLTLCSVSMIGCGQKTPSTADEENTNVKSETLSDDRSKAKNQDGIIILEDTTMSSILSENVSNADLEKAIINELDLSDEVAKQTRYYYNYVDLNGDGENEIVAEVVGPSTSGNDKDSVIIFKDNNGTLEKIDDFSEVKNPIIISDNKTNGYNDIIFKVSDSGTSKKYVVLKYDGNEYSDVNESETIDSIADINGSIIIANDMEVDKNNNKGLYLKK